MISPRQIDKFYSQFKKKWKEKNKQYFGCYKSQSSLSNITRLKTSSWTTRQSIRIQLKTYVFFIKLQIWIQILCLNFFNFSFNLGTVASCLVVNVETGGNSGKNSEKSSEVGVKMSESPRKFSLEQGNSEGLELLRKSLKSVQKETNDSGNASHVFVVFGASGDLAKKKIYPTLWALFKENLLPPGTQIVGYARSKISVSQIREKCAPWFKVSLFYFLKDCNICNAHGKCQTSP